MWNAKKILALALVLIILAVTIFVASTFGGASSESELTTLDMTKQFLSEVVGIDMSKYSLPSPPSGYEKLNITAAPYPAISEIANKETYGPSFDFVSSEGSLHGLTFFRYGHLAAVNLYDQNRLYYESPAIGVKDQASSILQRYQVFFTKIYHADASFLTPMQNILKTVNELSVTNTTYDGINFQVSVNQGRTRIQWIYTDDNITAELKRVELNFEENVFTSLSDTWSLYKISPMSGISIDAALEIAREAAQNVELHVTNEGVEQTFNVPDLSNATYEYRFSMTPYQTGSPPSNSFREPATLYPYWQFTFYFNKCVGRYSAVEVGLWGDTKDISSARGYQTPIWPNIQTPKPDSDQ
jgi:hypothetical protein